MCNPCSARSLTRLMPRNDDDDDIPNSLAAISKVPTAGWAQIAALGPADVCHLE